MQVAPGLDAGSRLYFLDIKLSVLLYDTTKIQKRK